MYSCQTKEAISHSGSGDMQYTVCSYWQKYLEKNKIKLVSIVTEHDASLKLQGLGITKTGQVPWVLLVQMLWMHTFPFQLWILKYCTNLASVTLEASNFSAWNCGVDMTASMYVLSYLDPLSWSSKHHSEDLYLLFIFLKHLEGWVFCRQYF